MASADCSAEHTDFQPSNLEWRCPKCSARAVDPADDEWPVTILGSDLASDSDCDSLHKVDEIKCSSCGWQGYGDEFAKLIQENMSGQDQRSTKEQIQKLVGIATKHKMYDAVDYLKRELERWDKR